MAPELPTFRLNRRALARGMAGGLALSALQPLAAFAQETAAPVIEDFAIGAEDAKVTISEYSSFTCPHCATFHAEVFPLLKAEYIDTGKVRFEYREVYFDRYGLWAAMMARCGGSMRYFGITDILFDTQKEWAASDDQAQVVANIKKIGVTAGMDAATVDQCLQDDAMAKALVAHYQTNAAADGLEGTPSFKINGVMHSNMPYEALKLILDTELAK